MSRFRLRDIRSLTALCAALGAGGLLAAAGLVMPVASDYLWRMSSTRVSAAAPVSSPLVRVRALPHGARPYRLLLIGAGVVVCTPATGRV
jgi:hypothetical protein